MIHLFLRCDSSKIGQGNGIIDYEERKPEELAQMPVSVLQKHRLNVAKHPFPLGQRADCIEDIHHDFCDGLFVVAYKCGSVQLNTQGK